MAPPDLAFASDNTWRL